MIKHVKAYEKQHFYFLFYNHDHTMMGIATIIIIWLVVSTSLKHISQMGVLFPINGKMIQTTNQTIFDGCII
jgi:uncharacterized membrane protein YgaE (UPF0421/DUF939 family)